ncbi:MAG: hypothetical protein C5B49_12375 [Bdellovibrio sp.]|nr:MAG: hypothetical protein C5B49_12375 [Bdellovibrio sp.]
MNEDQSEKKVRPRVEHVALEEESSQKINAWLEQVNAKKKGVKISRKDFVNWLIQKSPDNLSNGDLSALIEQFYNETWFLRQLLRDSNAAKAEGRSDLGFELVIRPKKPDVKRDASNDEPANDQSTESQ